MQSCSDVGIGTREDENVKMRLIEPHAEVEKKKTQKTTHSMQGEENKGLK